MTYLKRKSFLAFFLLFLSEALHASTIELFAKKMHYEDGVAIAEGDAVANGKEYFIRADKIVYKKGSEEIEAFGDIFILSGGSVYTLSKYALIKLDEKKGRFSDLFLQNKLDGVWLSCDKAELNASSYITTNSYASGCSPLKPDWYIKFKEGRFDEQSKDLTLKGATLYLQGMPLLYTPYMAFNTDKTRSSGLMKPDVAVSGNEGFLYSQGYYYTPDKDAAFDVEITPQMRTKRGAGLFSVTRFIDSAVSSGSLEAGYFKDKEEYKKSQGLKNDSHYGFRGMYQSRQQFFPSFSDKEGLFADLNYLNDVDYVNLQKDIDEPKSTDKITTSNLNYFLSKNDNFFGVYLKYFIDSSKASNDTTLQVLPKAQYHRESSSLLLKNLIYSVDIKETNYAKKVGLTASQSELFVPFKYFFTVANDYLRFSVGENIYLNSVKFSHANTNQNEPTKEYDFLSTHHTLGLSTSLMKGYEGFFHALDAETVYTKPGIISEKNYPATQNELTTLVTSSNERENVSLKLTQFLLDSKGDITFSHRLLQPVYMDAKDTTATNASKFGELRNEFFVKINENARANNDTQYSYSRGKLTYSLTYLSYEKESLSAKLSHAFKDNADIINPQKSNYYALSLNKKLESFYSVFGSFEYDAKLKEARGWNAGINMNKSCWNYELGVKKEIVPVLKGANAEGVKNFTVYFRLNLIPLGGLNQHYSTKTS